jgi:creatinine amidohydrolase
MEEMTSVEFQDALKETDTAIVPAGSTEVLGNHGPLGADSFVAAAVSKKIGERARCLVAPLIPVGDAMEIRSFPGTLTIRFDILKEFYLDICRSLVRHGIRRIFFFNAHMMNMRAVDHCGRTLRKDGVLVAQLDWWRVAFSVAADLVESTESPYGHGGEVITSVIKALRPDLVDVSLSAKERPKPGLDFHGKCTPVGGGPFYTYPDFTDFCDTGAWGDPSFATAEKGAIIMERAIEKIVGFLHELKRQPLPASGK